jgi:CHAT domain-containing protein
VSCLWGIGDRRLTATGAEGRLQTQLEQAQNAYELGNLTDAATLLEGIVISAQASGNALERAIAQGNLALVRGQQGSWSTANRLIADSVASLESSLTSSAGDAALRSVLAQTLNIQGRIELGQGNAEAAYHTWERAAQEFRAVDNRQGEIRSLTRQARALQAQGYYRRAVDEILLPLEARLRNEPASSEAVMGLLTLSEALQTVDSLEAAQRVADTSLRMAQQLRDEGAIAASYLNLGNIAYAQARSTPSNASSYFQGAENYYARSMQATETDPQIRHRAMLNQFSLLVEQADSDDQATAAVNFWRSTLHPQVSQFPVNRDGIYAQLNIVHQLSCLKGPNTCGHSFTSISSISWDEIEALLTAAQQQATALGDTRANAYVLGYWGAFYEHTGQNSQALQTTEQALVLAQSVNATEMTYRWYEQLGRLLEQQGDKERAIAAYMGAVQTLKTLRSDLASVNPEVQFSFNDSIDPIHRNLVSLLLTTNPGQPDDPAKLEQARKVIESLQLEELNDFLQASCLDTQDDISLDQIADEQRVAIIYPILLSNRIEVIVRLPQQPLRRYTSPIPQTELASLIQLLRDTVGSEFYSISLDFLEPATRMYDLLIRPMRDDLDATQPETLVFVLDGGLRNLPMAALFDGEQYLMQEYPIAVVPGLQLVDPQPIQSRRLEALTFGLTQSRQGFSELPNVEKELNAIRDTIDSKTWLNEDFTRLQFETTVSDDADPIVHLATHGQFSSNINDTFILSWDDKIFVNDLSQWISERDRPIELLVLSACETATGDQKAALGLAGMAVRAGARSTLASLWRVDDAATFEVMQRFYQELATTPGISKAKALQNAQKFILGDRPEFEHPFYWAPFILVGNWL